MLTHERESAAVTIRAALAQRTAHKRFPTMSSRQRMSRFIKPGIMAATRWAA